MLANLPFWSKGHCVLSRTILVIVAALLFVNLSGQSQFDYENVLLNQISIESGLSQGNVNCIHQDPEGFVWVGTDDGLNRYDGFDMRIYKSNPLDSNSISGNTILSIFEDSRRNLWIGTNQGLNLLNREKATFYHFIHDPEDENTISDNSVTNILEDKNGDLWFATYWGLNRYDPDNDVFTRFYEGSEEWGVGRNEIYDLEQIGDYLVIGHTGGISLLDILTGKFEHFEHSHSNPLSISTGQATDLLVDRKKRVWIGTDLGGLNLFDIESKTFKRFTSEDPVTHPLKSNTINELFEDWNGRVWVMTENSGISIYDESGNFEPLTTSIPTENTSIYTMHDGEDKVWIGTFGEGLLQFDKRGVNFQHDRFFHPIISESKKNSVLDFVEDHEGNIWIGTDGSGLFKYDPDSKVYTHVTTLSQSQMSLQGSVIKSLLVDSRGNLYVGTYLDGLYYLDFRSNRISKYSTGPGPNYLRNNSIWTLEEDHNGEIWIGTLNGLHRLNPTSGQMTFFENYLEDSTMYPSSFTSKIEKTQDNQLWFGTPVSLVRFDRETDRFVRYFLGNDSNPDEIRNIYLSLNQNLWIITNRGIYIYDKGSDSFDRLETEVEKSSQYQGIAEGPDGNLWVSGFGGITYMKPSGELISQFQVSDGLQGNQYNYDATLRASDGRFYFGGLNGINIFDPTKIRIDTVGPDVVLNDIAIFNKIVNAGDETGVLDGDIHYQEQIVLNHTQNFLTFHYSAFDFEIPKSIQFSYRLTGFDQEWNFSGDNRIATYTNLPPGTYEFQVRARNVGGNWTREPKSLQVIITAPFWAKTGFHLLIIVLIILAVILMFRWRTMSLKSQSAALEKHIEESTAELRREIEIRKKTENELLKTVNKLQETQNQLVTKEKMASVGILTAGIAHELNNPLNFIAGGLNILRNEFGSNDEASMKDLEELMAENDDMRIKYALKLISEGFNRSHLVVKSLTTLSNKDHPVLINTDLGELIDYVISSLESRLEGIDLEIDYNLETLMVIPDRLQQVIINVVENAIFATNANNHSFDKKIRISTSKILEQDIPKGMISISNTGKNIDEDTLPRIFDPFFTTKEVGVGNGLGLSTAYSFVEQQGGSIEAQNLPDGVAIVIKLPLHKK